MCHFLLPRRLFEVIGLLLIFTYVAPSQAVPSFARQTGLDCNACHTAFPQLNEFGRRFKIEGYTLAAVKHAGDGNKGFDLVSSVPLSMMVQTTWSKLSKSPDDSTDSSQVKFPSQLSLFYAGRIADKLGAFVQITAEEGEGFNQDNTDIRYADTARLGGEPLAWGVSLNNNPTVEDPWNSTPVWSFPWFEAGYDYAYPDTLISSLGGSVAGLSAYGFWNNHLYADAGAYQSANTGADLNEDAIDNGAPYWRLAYTANQGRLNWMAGTFGMDAQVYDPLQDTLSVTDLGLDTQLQWMLDGDQSLTMSANFIDESQPHGEHLDTGLVNLTWYTDTRWGVTVGYRGSRSSNDALAPDDDYRWVDSGDLGSDAYQLQLDYMPWHNARIAMQYTGYTRVNGASSHASDSNQLMLGAWLVF